MCAATKTKRIRQIVFFFWNLRHKFRIHSGIYLKIVQKKKWSEEEFFFFFFEECAKFDTLACILILN